MDLFSLTALFVCMVAAGGWLNARTLRLPSGVAMLFIGVIGALTLAGLSRLGPTAAAAQAIIQIVAGLDFSKAVLGYMLGFLLFAGAMGVDVFELRRRRYAVWTMATVGVVASTAIVGAGVWLIASALGLTLPLPWALTFGALISPTDPVAVLATIRRGQLSAALKVILQGEALFNDGVAIVIFTALVSFAAGGEPPNPAEAILAVFIDAVGGLALGLIAGFVVNRAMRQIDDSAVEVGLSLGLAMGVYAGAQSLGLSGPIAAVGAGLMFGGGRAAKAAGAHLISFWGLIDELLNAILFFMLGLILLVVPLEARLVGLAAAAIVLVLSARILVVLPWGSYLRLRQEQRGANSILVWGGLHGALSVALALSLPPGPFKGLILTITYGVCVFSVAAQGLTFAPLAARVSGGKKPKRLRTAAPPAS